MYYPYLRGKQYELILLKENAELLAASNICPIIEPVNEISPPFERTLDELNKRKVQFVLIVNPQVGNLTNKSSELDELADKHSGKSNMSKGYIVNEKSIPNHVKSFVERRQRITLIHDGYKEGRHLSEITSGLSHIERHVFREKSAGKLYRKHFESHHNCVLVRDGFNVSNVKRNIDYPEVEHFSDLHVTFPDENMSGFGDFLIVGDEYRTSGGPAYAVAIHMTYIDDDNDMFIRHFVSEHGESPTNTAGKFFEALEKLHKEYSRHNTHMFKSDAAKEYLELYKRQHFPGLGYIKKLSMQHHIELMADFITRKG